MLLIATLAALTAIVFASRWMMSQASNATTKVVVAATDVNLGQRIGPNFLKLTDWPSNSVPPGAYSDVQKLDGRVLKESLLHGEPIVDAKLTPIGRLGALAALIGEGKRAIMVRVNDLIGVAGFALPGNSVDIVVNTQKDHRDPGARRDQNISKTVLEKTLVPAVAQEVGRDETKPKVVDAVTLEVSPEVSGLSSTGVVVSAGNSNRMSILPLITALARRRAGCEDRVKAALSSDVFRLSDASGRAGRPVGDPGRAPVPVAPEHDRHVGWLSDRD